MISLLSNLLRNKKGIELAANFFVVMIISIVILGMGIYLVKMFFTTTEELKTNLDVQTEKEIQRILLDGKKVAIPINKREIKRGNGDVFGLGILNVIGDTRKFKVNIIDGPIIKNDNTKIEPTDPDYSPLEYLKKIAEKEILNNEQEILTIPVRVPRSAQIGTYILDVYVCECDDSGICPQCDNTALENTYDDSVHKIYVKVV